MENLKEIINIVLPDAGTVITWAQGFDKLHVTPLYAIDAKDAERAVWNPLCVHNLAAYLPFLKKKAAVVVKGCDSRTIVQYLQEGLIDRSNVIIIGVPCTGVVSVKKVLKAINHQPVDDVKFSGGNIIVKTPKSETTLAFMDVIADKCKTCQYPTPVIYDCMIGDPVKADKPAESVYDDIKEMDAKTLDERWNYFRKEFDKCIRCYACRNACPMCVCRDSCIAETRDPHWMTQRLSSEEKMMFHMIHAVHLAGRCVECGECERACPMDIPVARLKKKINSDMKELFDYVPGANPEDKPPMYTFNVDEAKIKEHKL